MISLVFGGEGQRFGVTLTRKEATALWDRLTSYITPSVDRLSPAGAAAAVTRAYAPKETACPPTSSSSS